MVNMFYTISGCDYTKIYTRLILLQIGVKLQTKSNFILFKALVNKSSFQGKGLYIFILLSALSIT